MRQDTLEVLRCPFCGGRLGLVESSCHRREGNEILDATLGCHCCAYPVVAGIPVLHLEETATTAREQIEAGHPDLARRTMLGIDEARAARFDEAAASDAATYRDIVDILGPEFEGGYFLYRFSDPTYVVADAVVRAVGGATLPPDGRAIDLCGGSGHLTRSLLDLAVAPPVLADLYFSKLWLARRFTAPGCEPVCCDGNAPLPFATGAFRFAVCSDAFHYIWTKRLFASEMMRLVDARGALAVTHTHNALEWNPSAGMPLPPDAYLDLFAGMTPRLFAEGRLLAEIVASERLDLSRREATDALDVEPALTLVAARNDNVFQRFAVERPLVARGEFKLNPLYAVESAGDQVALRLRFPSEDYEQEYGACRQYLPPDVTVDRAALAALAEGPMPASLRDLARRRVILDLPRKYR